MFSKNAEVLDLMSRLLGDNVHQLRRSNRIFHDGRFVKYPFENELSALSAADRDHCLETFLDNPYSHYKPQNMLQFFLATFGEGMTDLYLRPYNEKIWKFDPAFMDMQMVERIPKPPAEDILRSAKGEATEGYLHQLFFRYPETRRNPGVLRRLPAFAGRQGDGPRQRPGAAAAAARPALARADRGRRPNASSTASFRRFRFPTWPSAWSPPPPAAVADAVARLKFNSIAICCLQVERDRLAATISPSWWPIGDILFHRVSKLNFLLPEDRHGGPSVLMAEVTYRPGSALARLADDELLRRIGDDLTRLGFIRSPERRDGPGGPPPTLGLRHLRPRSPPQRRCGPRLLRETVGIGPSRPIRRIRVSQHGRRRGAVAPEVQGVHRIWMLKGC